MSQEENSLLSFDQQLSLEAERVLDDLIFTRAPIQSRLLRFLVDRAIEGKGAPSQYEIAVDGLGRDEDYDLDGDSYPRVQMSRVRRTLENYYARNLPGNGLKIKIDPGSYALTLVPAKGPEPVLSDEPADADLPSEPVPASPQRASPRLVALAVLGALGLLATPLMLMGVSTQSSSSGPEKPAVALIIDDKEALAGLGLPAGLTNAARQIAEVQLAGSFVSKPLALGLSKADAEYALTLNFAPGDRADMMAYLSLADEDGDVIYSNVVPFDPAAPERFEAELEASLVYMTSPTGAIAQAELPKTENYASSDYACFLGIENRRSNGNATVRLVDQCIELYPESSYRAFWHARRAFTRYQREIMAGRPIEKSGAAWAELREALEADRYNAFANFTAAKVELAQGNCDQARGYVNRALERGGSYPALVAAIEANAAACGDAMDELQTTNRLQALARFNPDPDPLLHLYLVAGLLAVGDRETAGMVAGRAVLRDPSGPVEETSDLLSRSLSDSSFARSNREEIQDAVYLFFWNRKTAAKIADSLAI